MRFRRCSFPLLTALLSGCMAMPALTDYPPLVDAPWQSYADRLLCRLTADCAAYPLLLVDRGEAQAELLPDGRLALRRGMLLSTRSEAELAFVLLHEIAHRQRRHRPTHSLAGRLPLELEADASAQTRLCALGYSADAGRDLLRRLRPIAAEDERERIALRQIDARLAALTPCPPPTQAQPPLLDEAAYAELRARLAAPVEG